MKEIHYHLPSLLLILSQGGVFILLVLLLVMPEYDPEHKDAYHAGTFLVLVLQIILVVGYYSFLGLVTYS